jgi:hypothetical protein
MKRKGRKKKRKGARRRKSVPVRASRRQLGCEREWLYRRDNFGKDQWLV